MQTTVDDMATEMADGVSRTISGSIVDSGFGESSTRPASFQAIFKGDGIRKSFRMDGIFQSR